MMNRLRSALLLALIFVFASVSSMNAQNPAPTPAPSPNAQAPAQKPEAAKPSEGEENPFAPEPAPQLQPGMTGSDVNDPRYKLTPGLENAGEVAMGLTHVLLG